MQQPSVGTFNSGSSYNSVRFFGFNFDLKKVISFFVILEAITATILFLLYLAFFDNIIRSLGTNQTDAKALASFFLAIMVYLLWKTFIAAYFTLNFIKHNDYPTISANRYIFAALSLSLGGLWTPFILTSLPNDNVQSSINPRYFLTKTYGIISSIGSLLALAAYFLALKTGINSLGNASIFQSESLIQSLTITTLALTLTLSAFGLLSVLVWKMEQKRNFDLTQSNPIFKVVSTIWLAIISLELILVLFYVIIRFIGVLSSIFNAMNRSGNSSTGILFSFIMLPIFMMQIMFQLLYTIWTVYIIKQTLSGLWKPQITYRTFESLSRYSEKAAQKNLKN